MHPLYSLKSFVFFLLLGIMTTAAVAAEKPRYNVIFLTLDGVRFQEFFEREQSSRRVPLMHKPQVGFPKLWEKLKEDTPSPIWIYGDPATGEKTRVSNPYAISLPGYQAIFSGENQGKKCRNNSCPQISVETFPERLIREAGFSKKDVASIASWSVMSRSVESKPGTVFLNNAQMPIEEPELADLNRQQLNDRSPWYPARYDKYTQTYALWYLKKIRPRFLHIGLNDSDELSHDKNYKGYIRSLRQYDDYIQELLQALKETGEYGRHTALIITTDHGRGRGFRWHDHSPEMSSAHRIFAVLKMPEAYAMPVQKISDKRFEQADIRPTIESLLGLEPLQGRSGKVLFKEPLSLETVQQLRTLRTQTRPWVEYCTVSATATRPELQYMSHGECFFGDMVIFAGLACLAGQIDQCADVKNSQGPDGRWWRSPDLVGIEQPESFSRDQGIGALAYLVTTRDREAALRWQHWIQTQGKGYRMCTITRGICDIHPGFANLMGDVWRELGLDPTFLMKISQAMPEAVKNLEALVVPQGFQFNLIGGQLLIRQRLALMQNKSLFFGAQGVANKLSRRQPINPFFMYLKDGPTEEVARRVLEQCPRSRPAAPVLDWAWQRAESVRAWEKASGHDCIFMINLLIGPEKDRIAQSSAAS